MNIYRAYLRAALALGFIGHVYRMTNRWGALVSPKKQDAAFEASNTLVAKHGYHCCPSCGWATKAHNEHLVGGSWCHEAYTLKHTGFTLDEIEEMQNLDLAREEERRQEERKFNGYDHRVPWDKQPDGISSFLAMPDREAHRQGLI